VSLCLVALVRRPLLRWIAVLSIATVGGCAGFGGGYDSEYGAASSVPPLDVPPDLTTPEWGRAMSVPGEPASAVAESRKEEKGTQASGQRGTSGGVAVLPEISGIEVRREGNTRWLRIHASPSQLWPRLRAFWREQGIPLKKDDPELGLMVTDWYEHRGALPQTGIRGLLGRVTRYLTDTGIRDRYRLRVERSDGSTDVYITTQRAAQATEAPAGDDTYDESTLSWALLPPDPQLDAEMLTKLMVYLGANEEQAREQIASAPDVTVNLRLVDDKKNPKLIVEDDFRDVWRLAGVALDRAGLYVEQQDRDKGIYYFTYTEEGQPKKSFFEKLFSSSGGLEPNELYELHVQDEGARTSITVHNSGENADKALAPKDAKRLLKRFMKYYQLGG